jgi:uncharacterized protein (TIGR00645 family)
MEPMKRMTAMPEPESAHGAGVVERGLERTIFATRWLLVPFYLGLVVGLLLLVVMFFKKTVKLAGMIWWAEKPDLVLGLLSLVDLSLMANLLVMVILAGYESFVSHLDIGSARLAWMGRISFGDLKLWLVASIVAISAVHLLEDFMEVSQVSDRHLAWRLSIHIAFVVSGVLLACMSRIMGRH